MRLVNFCFSFFSTLLVLNSCGKEQIPQNTSELSKTYLRINLDKIVRSLIPTSDGNESEKFLYTQLYEPLFVPNQDEKSINQLIDRVSIDSARSTYTFSLKNDRTFSDGQQLTTDAIQKCFLRLFASSSRNENILSFKRNIVGYADFERAKLSYSLKESLPFGIKIIDDFTFSLATKIIDPNLLNILSAEEFNIFKLLDSGKTIGSGPFAIDYSNDDINFTLNRNAYYNLINPENVISGINIRFIKNQDALIDEFLNESIDIIYFNSFYQEVPYLKSILSQKYGFKSYTEQDSATLQYLTFHNFTNSNIIDHLINELAVDTTRSIYSKSLNPLLIVDSIQKIYTFPIVNKTSQSCSKLLDSINSKQGGKLKLYLKEISEVNLNESYIVINEDHLKMSTREPEENTLELLLNNSQIDVSALTVMNYQYDMIIFNENLNGFTKYGHWTYDIKNLSFSRPKIF